MILSESILLLFYIYIRNTTNSIIIQLVTKLTYYLKRYIYCRKIFFVNRECACRNAANSGTILNGAKRSLIERVK